MRRESEFLDRLETGAILDRPGIFHTGKRSLMDELTTTKPVPAAAAADKSPVDLSGEIERSVAREPLDRVRCVRVFDDHYRCNWWSPGGDPHHQPAQSPWAALATQRVRKSQFITARLNAGQLEMEPTDWSKS